LTGAGFALTLASEESGEMRMKYVLAGLAVIVIHAPAFAQSGFTPSGTAATTCDQRARECRRIGLGGACAEPFRMAACRKTGVYTAPNGRAAEAKGR
jgi:hypothetical protein